MPERRAFWARLIVARRRLARIAKPHRHDRDLGRIVELRGRQPQPTAQPIARGVVPRHPGFVHFAPRRLADDAERSEEHTSELQSLMRISYAVFCLKKKKKTKAHQ